MEEKGAIASDLDELINKTEWSMDGKMDAESCPKVFGPGVFGISRSIGTVQRHKTKGRRL